VIKFSIAGLYRPRIIFLVFLLIAIVVGLQEYYLGKYNNFVIFRSSYQHLLDFKNLYRPFLDEYGDIFLYSPTFAFLMAPWAYIPMLPDLLIWTAFNSLAVYFAVVLLPKATKTEKMTIFLILIFEFITSLQNTQTSPFLVSCMVFAFISFERKNVFWAAFWIILATYIKVYALAAAILFILYPQKPKFILSMFFWGVLLLFLPLIAIPAKQLWVQYHNWFNQMAYIHQDEETGLRPNIAIPLSVMGWLKTWFNFRPPSVYIQGLGVAMLCLPYLRFKKYGNIRFRYFMLSSVLIFCMIFNHIAESPSYVIAVFGLAIWFAFEDKNLVSISLFVFAFIFTILIATDFFPANIRHQYAVPYVWKAVPCIVIWFYLQARLLFGKLETAGFCLVD